MMKTFIKKWSVYFVFAGVFSFFINLLYLTFPIYMLSIYDRVLQSYSMPTLVTITVGAIIALFTLGTLDFIRSRLLIKAGIDLDQSYNSAVLSQMVTDRTRINPMGFNQGMADLTKLKNYFSSHSLVSFFDIPWVPIYLGIIYILHPLMGMVATVGTITIICLGLFQEMITRKKISKTNSHYFRNQNLLNALLRNAETVLGMGMVDNATGRWKKQNQKVLELQVSVNGYTGLIQSVTKTLRISLQVAIYGVGAYLTIMNNSTPGIMIAASIIMGRALQPIEACMSTWKNTVEVREAFQRLKELLQFNRKDETMKLPDPKGYLQVKSVSLVHQDRYLLKNINFELEPGELMGIVGPSAAGKSTLCRVLLGVWPAVSGKIRLDGADVFQWDKIHLGTHLGYLPQTVELLPGTIAENIARMGEIDSEKVIQAAKEAGAHNMILQLPQGYDTAVTESCMELSGGQIQLIGLARALYNDPCLVIMDEPNTSLDQQGESRLKQVLALLKTKKSTCIIVAHNLSFLKSADKILVMKEGSMVMYGPKTKVDDHPLQQWRKENS